MCPLARRWKQHERRPVTQDGDEMEKFAVSEDRTHDLRIMRPTRYQLRYHRFCPTLMPDVFLFVVNLHKRIDVCCRESRQRLRRLCHSGRCPRAATAAKAAEMTAAEKESLRAAARSGPSHRPGQKHFHQTSRHKSAAAPAATAQVHSNPGTPTAHAPPVSRCTSQQPNSHWRHQRRCTSRRPQKPSPPGDSCTNQSLHLPTHPRTCQSLIQLRRAASGPITPSTGQ